MFCKSCGDEITAKTSFCGHCGAAQGIEVRGDTGWFDDPSGRWEARYFQEGQPTNQISARGESYVETPAAYLGNDNGGRSRVMEALFPAEVLLHEAAAEWMGARKTDLLEEPGILALTNLRVVKYQTGKGLRSTLKGEGKLELHWWVALPPFEQRLISMAAGGDSRAQAVLGDGFTVVGSYRSGPIKPMRHKGDEIADMGERMAQICQRLVEKRERTPSVAERLLPGALGKIVGAGNQLGEAHSRYVHAAVRAGKTIAPQRTLTRRRTKDLDLRLSGAVSTLTRIDQVLSAAPTAYSSSEV